MSTITVSKKINAPKAIVFKTIADIRNFSEAVPDIVDIEFLSSQKYGKGTKFRELREMNGKNVSTELEVTELNEGENIRLVSDAGGTIWDSVFTVSEENEVTELTLVMEAKPYKLLPKLLTPFMKVFMRKALEKDLNAVKDYCENLNSR